MKYLMRLFWYIIPHKHKWIRVDDGLVEYHLCTKCWRSELISYDDNKTFYQELDGEQF